MATPIIEQTKAEKPGEWAKRQTALGLLRQLIDDPEARQLKTVYARRRALVLLREAGE